MAPINFESLEARQLFAANLTAGSGLIENSWRLNDPGFGNTRSTAAVVEVTPMLNSRVIGNLSDSNDVDMFKVRLTKGHYLTADVDSTTATRPTDMKLTIYDSKGKRVAANNNAVDPETGEYTSDPNLIYRVRKSGAYYLRLSNTKSYITGLQNYELNVRPVGLNTGNVSHELLQNDSGAMSAILNGKNLSVSGPTGHGFMLQGNWKKQVTGSGADAVATYSVTGKVVMRTLAGKVSMHVPRPMSLSITTQPNVFARQFGEVASIDWNADLGIAKIAKSFNRGFGLKMGGLSVMPPQRAWGLKLGSDPLLQNTSLPVNPAVPYLYLIDNKSLDISFGGMSASPSQGYSAAFIVDPADSLFISAKANGLAEFAVGLSHDGLIPFTANTTPAGYTGEVYGHVFSKAGLDISAINPAVPLSVNGDITIDLDANDDGKTFGGLNRNTSELLAGGFSAKSLGKDVDRVFSDVDIAVNGEVEVGYEKAGFGLSVPVGEASVIYAGTRGALFARGGSVNPFQDTPLEVFGSRNRIDINAYVNRSGTFKINANGTYQPLFYRIDGDITLDNNGVRAAGTMKALGANVRVTGNINSNGTFNLTGKARAALGPISGDANFRFVNTGSRVSMSAALDARLATKVLGVDVGGSIAANVAIGATGSGLTYSARGSAKLFVGPVTIGPEVQISNRELAIRLDARPVLDHWLRVPLPA
jgi:hypothetical protein